jgi:hypothetical protein
MKDYNLIDKINKSNFSEDYLNEIDLQYLPKGHLPSAEELEEELNQEEVVYFYEQLNNKEHKCF